MDSIQNCLRNFRKFHQGILLRICIGIDQKSIQSILQKFLQEFIHRFFQEFIQTFPQKCENSFTSFSRVFLRNLTEVYQVLFQIFLQGFFPEFLLKILQEFLHLTTPGILGNKVPPGISPEIPLANKMVFNNTK